jgi:hypothetical protein
MNPLDTCTLFVQSGLTRDLFVDPFFYSCRFLSFVGAYSHFVDFRLICIYSWSLVSSGTIQLNVVDVRPTCVPYVNHPPTPPSCTLYSLQKVSCSIRYFLTVSKCPLFSYVLLKVNYLLSRNSEFFGINSVKSH